jgi:putative Mg2+ transporter-C (MgtC) family protein
MTAAVRHVQITDGELLLRLAMAAVLCALIGLERSARDEVAGLRTHTLVGLGAALFTLVSAYGFNDYFGSGEVPDPTRIASQIVSGVGFLGAGAIIRQGLNVRGVTTASSLWIVAAIGMASGAGFYLGAVVSTVLVLVVLVVMRPLRVSLMRAVRSDYVILDVDLRPQGEAASVVEVLAHHRVRVESMRSDLAPEAERLHFELRVPPRMDFVPILHEIGALEGVAASAGSGMRPELRLPSRSGRTVPPYWPSDGASADDSEGGIP